MAERSGEDLEGVEGCRSPRDLVIGNGKEGARISSKLYIISIRNCTVYAPKSTTK